MDAGARAYQRLLDGDDQGIVEIVRIYKDGLILFINRYVHNLHVAEELAEDTFFRLLIKQPKFDHRFSFKTWLYTIGRNRALDYLRFSARFHPASDDVIANMISEQTDLETAYIQKEDRLILLSSMNKIKQQYSDVLYLSYFESLSIQEISRVLHKSKKQIENLLFRAKQSLKIQLEKEGFVYEEL